MNTLKLTLLITFSACLTFSCSKDNAPAKIDSKLIIGTWKLTKSSKNGNVISLTACDLLNTLFFSSTQATYIYHYKGTNTVCSSDSSIKTYSINDNTITESNKSKEIITLSSTELVLEYEETKDNEVYVVIDTYVKQ